MNIIVTGASSGIGYQTVLKLATKGQNHILAIARNKDDLKKLETEFKSIEQSKINLLSFDLENADYNSLINNISSIFELDKESKIDILINNAGYLANKNFIELDDEDWRRTFEINLFAPAKLIKLLFPFFNRKSTSHIVNIGSMGGIQGSEKFEGLSAYSASKGALNILTESLAKEFKDENIAINSLNPGAVQTKMLEEAFPGYKAPIQSNEIAEYIAYFATTGQKYMNGKVNQLSFF